MATKQFVLLVAVVGGIAFGIVLNLYSDASYGTTASTLIGIPAEIFLRLLKLVITPIIFTTIVLAIMRSDRAGGDTSIGKVVKAYLGNTLFIACLGYGYYALWPVSVLQLDLGAGPPSQESVVKSPQDWASVVVSYMPDNVLASLAQHGNLFHILIVSVLIGCMARQLKDAHKATLLAFFEALYALIENLLNLVIRLLPLGIFFLAARSFATSGVELLGQLLVYMVFIASLLLLILFVLYPVYLLLCGRKVLAFYRSISAPMLFAFSSSSSACSVPVTIKTMTEDLGLPEKLAAISASFGAVCHKNGSAATYVAITLFASGISQVPLSPFDIALLIAFAATISSVSPPIPGGPLMSFLMMGKLIGIPVDTMLMLYAVDAVLDMPRTCVNVTGDLVVTSCVVGSHHRQQS